jgi:hypothetical protein
VRSGFRDVEVRTMAAPLRLGSAAECLRFEGADGFEAPGEVLVAAAARERRPPSGQRRGVP